MSAEHERCQREIDRHQEADKPYMDEGVQILAGDTANSAKNEIWLGPWQVSPGLRPPRSFCLKGGGRDCRPSLFA
jgi:hypothetical protein